MVCVCVHACYQMKAFNHDNVNEFVGMCISLLDVFVVTGHCHKGSLQVINQSTALYQPRRAALRGVLRLTTWVAGAVQPAKIFRCSQTSIIQLNPAALCATTSVSQFRVQTDTSSSSSSFSLIISWQAQPVHNIGSEQYNRYTLEVQHVQLNAINMN